MTFSLGLATFLTPKTQPNRAKTSFYEAKPCILQCFCVFLHDFRVFEAPGGPRAAPGAPQGVPEALRTPLGGPNGASAGPPGVLLERSWCLLKRSRDALDGSWRLLAAPRALPGRFWRSPHALLGFWSPGTSFSSLFLSGKPFSSCVWRHRNQNRNRLLVFSFGSFRSRVLGFSSGVLGFSSGVFGFSSGVVGFSSGVLACDSGVLGCIFSSGASALRSWALARGSWALALGPSPVFLALGL